MRFVLMLVINCHVGMPFSFMATFVSFHAYCRFPNIGTSPDDPNSSDSGPSAGLQRGCMCRRVVLDGLRRNHARLWACGTVNSPRLNASSTPPGLTGSWRSADAPGSWHVSVDPAGDLEALLIVAYRLQKAAAWRSRCAADVRHADALWATMHLLRHCGPQ